MQIRVVRFESKNLLVGIALLVVLLAILAFVLTAGVALLAGGAAIGGVGYLVRRLVGGRQALGASPVNRERVLRPEDEVFLPGATSTNRFSLSTRSERNAEVTERPEVTEENS